MVSEPLAYAGRSNSPVRYIFFFNLLFVVLDKKKKKKNPFTHVEKGNSCTISSHRRRPDRLPPVACPAIPATSPSAPITTTTRPQPRGAATHNQLHCPDWPSPPPGAPYRTTPSCSPTLCDHHLLRHPVRRGELSTIAAHSDRRPIAVDAISAEHTFIGVSKRRSNLLRFLLLSCTRCCWIDGVGHPPCHRRTTSPASVPSIQPLHPHTRRPSPDFGSFY
jgi:hypothetical protein